MMFIACEFCDNTFHSISWTPRRSCCSVLMCEAHSCLNDCDPPEASVSDDSLTTHVRVRSHSLHSSHDWNHENSASEIKSLLSRWKWISDCKCNKISLTGNDADSAVDFIFLSRWKCASYYILMYDELQIAAWMGQWKTENTGVSLFLERIFLLTAIYEVRRHHPRHRSSTRRRSLSQWGRSPLL